MSRRLLNGLALFILSLGAVLILQNFQAFGPQTTAGDRISTFATIFLGIFVEAAPFLLLGTLASGVVEVFVRKEDLDLVIPRNPFLGALAGGMVGLFFPVCECGVVPFTRRLFKKGLSPGVGISFLLAAPVLNPIVIASTYAAFGWGPVLLLRVGLSFLVAVLTGLIFSVQPQPARLLRPAALAPISGGSGQGAVSVAPIGPATRLRRALIIAADEFFEMGRYLVLGALMAALMQTWIPQTALLSIGTGPVLSVFVMMGLAVVLSVCSTVDSFIALAFTGTFTTGSLLAFLIFGPMVDVKNFLMFLRVFERRVVAYLILLTLMMTALISIFLNLNTAL